MRVARRGFAERGENVQLPQSVADMVVAARDMGDFHLRVVGGASEVVSRRSVGAQNDRVVEFDVVDGGFAFDEIDERYRPRERRFEPDRGLDSARRRFFGIAPAAIVARRLPGCDLRLAQSVQFGGRGVAIIRRAALHKIDGQSAMLLAASGLINRRRVGRQANPVQRRDDGINRLLRRPRGVGVFDAQQKLALAVARESPTKKSGARAAQMQIAAWAGREPSARRHRRGGSICAPPK